MEAKLQVDHILIQLSMWKLEHDLQYRVAYIHVFSVEAAE